MEMWLVWWVFSNNVKTFRTTAMEVNTAMKSKSTFRFVSLSKLTKADISHPAKPGIKAAPHP